MLAARSMSQTMVKLERLARTLKERMFIPVGEAKAMGFYQTKEPLNQIPGALYGPVPADRWGSEGEYGWFHMEYTVPEELNGKALFLYPRMGFYEATLWVNGAMHSNYAAKYVEGSHGNHWCNRFAERARAGEKYCFDLEAYSFHLVPGTQPLSHAEITEFTYPVGAADVCVRDEEITAFLFDLGTLLSLRKALPENSLRRAEAENALFDVHLKVLYDPDNCTDEEFHQALREAHPYILRELEKRNGSSAPYVGLIGHSHMDTAWLWPISETRKKCARTYAGQLSLMEEYPEYKFVQSSAAHADFIREDNPALFERMRQKVKEGRWEPNGGVWVECDCNLTGGEYMVRQFLWGQRFTRKYFDYTADCFWLPDTFGYSYAIPQIMKGCGVNYFLTTKINWGDTNTFPMTTFYWQGIDGTKVLTHFNRIHVGPTPETLCDMTEGGDGIREKRVAPLRLFSFGKGDGGGGPEFEMLENARRLEDLEGVPRTGYTSVSDFMKRLEKEAVRPSTWAGELYLELHRGTLTNQHDIKRNNRKAEIALHNLEAATVLRAVREGKDASEDCVRPLMQKLLINQFHDILPGTCIHAAHAQAKREVGGVIESANELTQKTLAGGQETVVFNPLSFERNDTFYLSGAHAGQVFTDLDGNTVTAVSGASIPAFSAVPVPAAAPETASPFVLEGNHLTTPYAEITFDDNGAMASFIDRRTGRELVKGLPFNTFVMMEDLPADWDNWDFDADEEEKFAPAGQLISRQVVSEGPAELRIRSEYRLTDKTTLWQDMVFDAASPLISFDTVIDWQEEHRFLKAAFDTALLTDGVRSEIQFGHIRRSNHRSTPWDRAKFEVCNHKYSDLSEENYGIALLNDCKYGISVNEGSMRLSLHKGGVRPDAQGDKGRHHLRYALLPHNAPFGAESVIRPAYAFNNPPVLAENGFASAPLVTVDQPNVIIETVKPCEDTQRAYILRLYEAAGGSCRARLTFSHAVKALRVCNMLEEEQETLKAEDALEFTPFHITTLKICY